MNFKKHPLFILTALVLLFPIGLVFLLISDQTTKMKWILGICGLLLFLLLLSAAFLFPSKSLPVNSIEIVATRTSLTVGQSGGLAVTSNGQYLTEFTASSDSDILTINHNVYTAQQTGSALLTVSHNGIEKSIRINVIEGDSTIDAVYCSPSGERYHKNASHAGKNGIEMTEEDALQSKKSPCRICYR